MQQMRERLHPPGLPQGAASSQAGSQASQRASRPGAGGQAHVRGMSSIEEAMLKLETSLHRLTSEHSGLQSLDESLSG